MKKTTILAWFMVFGLLQLNAQKTITVDNSPGSSAQFNDLQSAIFSAEAGDTLYIHASETNYGTITVDKSLTLVGFSHSAEEKETLIDKLLLNGNTSGSSISGIHITGYIWLGEALASSNLTDITVENCRIDNHLSFVGASVNNALIKGNYIGQIIATSNSSLTHNFSNTLITNNIFAARVDVVNHQSVIIKNNLFLNGYVTNSGSTTGSLTVQNCIFYGSRITFDLPGMLYENCLTYNINGRAVEPLNGSDNIDNIDPQFVNAIERPRIFDPLTDDFRLQEGSLAIGAGVSGEDIGLYDNSGFTFNNFGYTDGVPRVKITAMTATVAPGNNLNLTISTNID